MRHVKFTTRELVLRWLNRHASRALGLLGTVSREQLDSGEFIEPELMVVRFWIGDDAIPIFGANWTQVLLRVKAALPDLARANAIAEAFDAANHAADEREREERIARNRAYVDALPPLVRNALGDHTRAIAR